MTGTGEQHNLIVEVLCDSTEAYDRGDQFARYRTLPGLTVCLMPARGRLRAGLFVRCCDDAFPHGKHPYLQAARGSVTRRL